MAQRKRVNVGKIELSNAIDLVNKTIVASHLCAVTYNAGNKAKAEAMAFKALLLIGQDACTLDKTKRHKAVQCATEYADGAVEINAEVLGICLEYERLMKAGKINSGEIALIKRLLKLGRRCLEANRHINGFYD